MRKLIKLITLIVAFITNAQTNPAITGWLINTTGITGRHYVAGNSTPINDAVLANVQTVQYNTTYSYISATGIPAYITGPFLDGNPSLATAQNKIFRIPLNPVQGTGTTATTGGNIGVFKNGVALFDYRDGVAWNNTTGALCGGPGNPPCSGTTNWTRDAIPAERAGFDCAKAHPAMGNYHHHQNPSAFNLDLVVLSNVCNTYPADGLYVINPSQHSPLLGFAYDGFPIYGAYAYTNTDGTGAITRMKSSYQLKSYPTGLRTNGPAINQVVGTQTFFNGYFREDYEYIAHPGDPTYLDSHNGRICNTPEYPASLYPNGIYCYFTTVDANHNSAYPYVVGPTFYGNITVTTPTSVPGGTTTLTTNLIENPDFKVTIAPNPASEFIAIQTPMATNDMDVYLINELGQIVKTNKILQGSTLSIIETDTIYNGIYFVKVTDGKNDKTVKVIINK
ncbi:YHYH protein [Flavobacterium sp. AS60]|uniref:YHYH protein n=1 Tax=Flavobacterium anseongense TaxID=2910677 RepID=UPI001F1E7B2F|nr:YHYH protein [Flavobacterium sp. AS60]MCF6129517.1 YHYH protein [Flavobacterium sp. AS60]